MWGPGGSSPSRTHKAEGWNPLPRGSSGWWRLPWQPSGPWTDHRDLLLKQSPVHKPHLNSSGNRGPSAGASADPYPGLPVFLQNKARREDFCPRKLRQMHLMIDQLMAHSHLRYKGEAPHTHTSGSSAGGRELPVVGAAG